MKKFISVILPLLLVLCSDGQHLARYEADSLIVLLTEKKPAADRLNTLLLLADFHIFKLGENKSDLDSAARLITEAKRIAGKINSVEANAAVALVESCLLREDSRQREAAKEMAQKAMQDLQSGKNPFYLGRACYEVAGYYDFEISEQLEKKNSPGRTGARCLQGSGQRFMDSI